MKFKTIKDLKSYFENTPEEELEFFLHDVFSWRGNHNEVAFIPSKLGIKRISLTLINRALSEEFTDYKGHCNKYNENTNIHFEYFDTYKDDDALYKILGKIQSVIIYECLDGTRWNTREEAKKYADLYDDIEDIYSKYLSSDTSKYVENQKYIPQDKEKCIEYKTKILELAAKYIPYYEKQFNQCITGERHISHAERYVDDSQYPKLREAFFRLACISENYIEYDQPYYADHEDVFIENYISKN